MPSSILIKAAGLDTSSNSLSTPDGSLSKASNVIIFRDNVVESRRGFKIYGNNFGTSTDRAKQLVVYRDRILRHYTNKLQFDNGGVFTDFSGTFNETETGLRIKSIQANGNFYFTTDEGIKKISATSGSELTSSSGYIIASGGVKAIDFQARVKTTSGTQSAFFTQDSTVAYRHVWGIIDANSNLILGSPSQRVEVFNTLLNLMLRDHMRLLGALDDISVQSGSIINDANYISSLGLSNTASASDLRSKLISLAEKLDKERGTLAGTADIDTATIASGVCTIDFAAAFFPNRQFEVGDKIFLSGFTPASGTLDGVQTVISVDLGSGASVIKFNTTASGAVTLSSESIESGWFRSITQPSIPSTVPTDQELVSLQTYISNIIIELQSSRHLRRIAKNDGSATASPLELDEAGSSIAAANAVTIAIVAPGDVGNFLSTGDKIFLSGTWKDSLAVSFAGVQTITGTTATTFSFTHPGSALAIGAVDLDTDSTTDRILRFTSATKSTYIDPLEITTTTTVLLDIAIPQDITTSHFLQIYRTVVSSATGAVILSDLNAGDEMRLVYEAFPTQTEIDTKLMIVEDIVPDTLRDGGTNLYTNSISGEGILQANDIPPFAKDINRFKNVLFYANTRTRHRRDLALLGVSTMIDLFTSGTTPKINITDGSNHHTYDFVTGIKEVTSLACGDSSMLSGAGASSYFLINSANNINKYYVWYKKDSSTDPGVAGRTGILVDLTDIDGSGTASASVIASRTRDKINSLALFDFTATSSGSNVTITNVDVGYTDDSNIGTLPGSFTITTTTQGRGERSTQEITSITCVADVADSLNGKYFNINTAFNRDLFYVFYKTSAALSDPAPAGRTGIQVNIATGASATAVATATKDALNALSNKFIASSVGAILTVKNFDFGPAIDATPETSGFTISITQQGALEVLLSSLVSIAQAIDETARSLVRIVNRNEREVSYGFYLSGPADTPGKMLLERKTLSSTPFYLLANHATTGFAFSPDLSPESGKTITAISVANPTMVTIATVHGLLDGDQVVISGSDSLPNIDGLYIISEVTPTTFKIQVNVRVAGTTGAIRKATLAEVSNNEIKVNRIYFSKFQQPEAVPVVNTMDVGSENKAILRIFPLRDSLFVFKEDGLFRISGEISPFITSLFDSSYTLIASDSVDVSNNQVYGWTDQGISMVSEAGTNIISRSIDVDVLPKALFPNFETATWGVGYESDNAYIVWTLEKSTDTVAKFGFRYNTLTNTWTTIDKSNTCGVVNLTDGKLYLGAGDINFIEQERKDFLRSDYADREFSSSLLSSGHYISGGEKILLTDVSNFQKGDVLFQEQFLTVFEFNLLLKKLDLDSLGDSDYFSLLQASGGSDLRDKLANTDPTKGLAKKLDADSVVFDTDYFSKIDTKTGIVSSNTATNPTVITTGAPHGLISDRIVTISGTNAVPSIDGTHVVTVISPTTFSIPVSVLTPTSVVGAFTTIDSDFRDIKACYNFIASKLNGDTGVTFSNYSQVDTVSIQEAVITNVNKNTKEITLDVKLPYIVGPLTIFKAIKTEIIYNPNTMGDPLGLKHLREATLMFEDRTFTNATISFATDLFPSFVDVAINGLGGGLFGHQSFGDNFFGGRGNSAPFRTYIPRNCQRCRFLLVKFVHMIAREKYSILAHSITGEIGQSSRAYR